MKSREILTSSCFVLLATGCADHANIETKSDLVIEPQVAALVEIGASALVLAENADRSLISISIEGTNDVWGSAEIAFGNWMQYEELGERWESPESFYLTLNAEGHLLEVFGKVGSTPSILFDNEEINDPIEGTDEIRRFNRIARSIFDENIVAELTRGGVIQHDGKLRQASTGTAYHQYTKKLHSGEPNSQHCFDFSYLASPQWTQTYGGWDCAFSSCFAGTETKLVYHVGTQRFDYPFTPGDGNHHATNIHTSGTHSVF